jgi:uridine kinase
VAITQAAPVVPHASYRAPDQGVRAALRGFGPLLEAIDRLETTGERAVIGLDGRCAAGKTRLAGALEQVYGLDLIHLDDFFLRPTQATPRRLAEPGGNLDRERFRAEALDPWLAGRQFEYRPWDCRAGAFGPAIGVGPGRLLLGEGSDALHPGLAPAYRLGVFLTVDRAEQRRRLAARAPDLLDRFTDRWIPLEEAYIKEFAPDQKADLLFQSAG